MGIAEVPPLFSWAPAVACLRTGSHTQFDAAGSGRTYDRGHLHLFDWHLLFRPSRRRAARLDLGQASLVQRRPRASDVRSAALDDDAIAFLAEQSRRIAVEFEREPLHAPLPMLEWGAR